MRFSAIILVLVVLLVQFFTRKNGKQAALDAAIKRIEDIRVVKSQHSETLQNMKIEYEKMNALALVGEISKQA